MHIRVNRRSAFVAGVVGTIGALVIGAAAFAGGGVGSQSSRPRTLAVSRLGKSQATVAAGATRDIKVLDAGTVSITVDSTASTFTVGTIVVSPGWKAVPTIVDGTNASVLFTDATRRIVVTLAFDTGVLTVTITEVPQDTTVPTTTPTTVPPTSTTSTTEATTTVPTTAATTTTPTTEPSTTTSVTVAGTAVTCVDDDEDEDDDDGDEQGEDCDDDDDDVRSTTATSSKSNSKHDDDDDDDDHGGNRGSNSGRGGGDDGDD